MIIEIYLCIQVMNQIDMIRYWEGLYIGLLYRFEALFGYIVQDYLDWINSLLLTIDLDLICRKDMSCIMSAIGRCRVNGVRFYRTWLLLSGCFLILVDRFHIHCCCCCCYWLMCRGGLAYVGLSNLKVLEVLGVVSLHIVVVV